MADTSSAREIASEILDEIKPTVDESDYQSAYELGSAVPYEIAAKQLIQGRS
jgi:hypothetical protein